MNRQRCEGCKWFLRYTGQSIGECRRYPPQHTETTRDKGAWLVVNETQFCGEWADGSITPQETERRELVRQFAMAIVQGMYANPEDTSVQVAKQAQLFAREFQETMQEGQQ